MKMIAENCSRKLDHNGRLVIPKSLRDRLGIVDGDSVDFYFLEDDEERRFVCITKDDEAKDRKKERIIELCLDLGVSIPEDLYD